MQSQVMVLFATLLAFITCVYGVPTPLGLTEGLEVRNSTIEKRFAGDVTWYSLSVGLNSCGWINQDNQMVAAVSFAMMGPQSNGNPNCARNAWVTVNGNTIEVSIVDKCGSCNYEDIDLSSGAFKALGLDIGVGRVHGTWVW